MLSVLSVACKLQLTAEVCLHNLSVRLWGQLSVKRTGVYPLWGLEEYIPDYISKDLISFEKQSIFELTMTLFLTAKRQDVDHLNINNLTSDLYTPIVISVLVWNEWSTDNQFKTTLYLQLIPNEKMNSARTSPEGFISALWMYFIFLCATLIILFLLWSLVDVWLMRLSKAFDAFFVSPWGESLGCHQIWHVFDMSAPRIWRHV